MLFYFYSFKIGKQIQTKYINTHYMICKSCVQEGLQMEHPTLS